MHDSYSSISRILVGQRAKAFRTDRRTGARTEGTHPPILSWSCLLRWKQLYDLEKQQRDQLENQIKEARERLLEEETFAVKDWQTQQLR